MIKIERKATSHTQEAMDDLQEACNTGRSYNTEHVNQALQGSIPWEMLYLRKQRGNILSNRASDSAPER